MKVYLSLATFFQRLIQIPLKIHQSNTSNMGNSLRIAYHSHKHRLSIDDQMRFASKLRIATSRMIRIF